MTKKQTITVSQTFDVINAILENVSDTTIAEVLASKGLDATPDVFRAKEEHMSTNAHKTSKRTKAPSKASIENANYAKQVATFLETHPEEVITLKWVMEHVDYVTTTQKAVAVINVLLKDGTLKKSDTKVDGHVAYTKA